jgi:hypothetical protein
VLRTDDADSKRGVVLKLADSGATVKPCMHYYAVEKGSTTSATCGSDLTINTWNLVVFKHSPYGDYGKGEVGISVNGGSFTTTALAYYVSSGAGNDFKLGGTHNHNVYFDGLGIWARVLSDEDVTELDAVEAYPFY